MTQMKELVNNFAQQLQEAVEIGNKAKLTLHSSKINNVLICGLGGSGIGGSIVSDLAIPTCTVPIAISKGYFIPAFVNENTLVIVSSYSGNTEETINCFELALAKNAKIVCITSGGKIKNTAIDKGLDLVIVPGGMPPRSCLGYSLTQLLFVLNFFHLTSFQVQQQLSAAINLILAEKENMIAEAKKIAQLLQGKIPVIYSTTYNEGIAVRFRQQLNENSKILCWHQVIPEMNHNELVGWTEKNDSFAVLILLDQTEYSRNLSRVAINKEVIAKYAHSITEVYSKGDSTIEKAIYFIHLCDWISVELADLRGIDATEVNVINHLKSKLADL
jgi:glucose/mannose-6-phosphate isomerase